MYNRYMPNKYGPNPLNLSVDFAWFHCACVGFLQVLRLPPTVQKHVYYANERFEVAYRYECESVWLFTFGSSEAS